MSIRWNLLMCCVDTALFWPLSWFMCNICNISFSFATLDVFFHYLDYPLLFSVLIYPHRVRKVLYFWSIQKMRSRAELARCSLQLVGFHFTPAHKMAHVVSCEPAWVDGSWTACKQSTSHADSIVPHVIKTHALYGSLAESKWWRQWHDLYHLLLFWLPSLRDSVSSATCTPLKQVLPLSSYHLTCIAAERCICGHVWDSLSRGSWPPWSLDWKLNAIMSTVKTYI